MFCPSCGIESLPEQRFCKGCGAALGASGNAESVSPVAAGQFAPAVPPAGLTTAVSMPYRLFDADAVGLAAFICSPLAGAILMAVNYRRLGKAGKGVLAVILGLIATALTILIKWNWNTSLGSGALAILFFICTWQIAKEVQGKAVEEHTARGGQLGSRWTAFFVGIATLAVLLGVICAAVYQNQNHKMVVIGTKDQVIYSGIATKANATALGNALKSHEYFQDRGVTVLLNKGIGRTTISFGVQDGVWNQAGMLSSFEELAREVAPAVGGLPVQVHLVDSKGDVEETSTVGEVSFDGSDGVYYEGSATKAQAQALGQQFESKGFFRGKGVNVLLTRHDDGTTLAFVVAEGVWNNPNKVSDFEAIVRDVAPLVGGLPIDMHLVNTQLQVEKDEVIK
jgi:hypothetical protein